MPSTALARLCLLHAALIQWSLAGCKTHSVLQHQLMCRRSTHHEASWEVTILTRCREILKMHVQIRWQKVKCSAGPQGSKRPTTFCSAGSLIGRCSIAMALLKAVPLEGAQLGRLVRLLKCHLMCQLEREQAWDIILAQHN